MDDLISRQAAINMKGLLEDWTGKEYEAVLVKDIEQLPPAQLGTNLAEVGTDCISRQQAIDVATSATMEWDGMYVQDLNGRIREAIEQLPPASCSEFPNNSDTISRQAAIEALTEYGNGRAVFISVGEAVIRIEQLPSAEPKRGKWIDANICGELPVIVCDQCHTFFPIAFGDFHNFCPNCGAKMETADGRD